MRSRRSTAITIVIASIYCKSARVKWEISYTQWVSCYTVSEVSGMACEGWSAMHGDEISPDPPSFHLRTHTAAFC